MSDLATARALLAICIVIAGALVAWAITVSLRRTVASLFQWRLPMAITDLRLGAHQLLLVKVNAEMTQEQLARTLEHVRGLFRANGVDVPIIIVGQGLEFLVVGGNVADARQKVPA